MKDNYNIIMLPVFNEKSDMRQFYAANTTMGKRHCFLNYIDFLDYSNRDFIAYISVTMASLYVYYRNYHAA